MRYDFLRASLAIAAGVIVGLLAGFGLFTGHPPIGLAVGLAAGIYTYHKANQALTPKPI